MWDISWFCRVDTFQRFSKDEGLFIDKVLFGELIKAGIHAVNRDDIDKLRNIVLELYQIRVVGTSHQDIFSPVNII